MKLVSIIFSLFCWLQPAASKATAEILWDEWGVPHIFAENTAVASYASGRSQAHLHGNLLLRLYGEARGRASEYWGAGVNNINYLTDLASWADEIPVTNNRLYNAMDSDSRLLLEAFAAGFNDYVNENRDEFDIELLKVMPLSGRDIWAHTNRVVTLFAFGGAKTGSVRQEFLSEFKGVTDEYRSKEGKFVHYSSYVDYDAAYANFSRESGAEFGSNVWSIAEPVADSRGAKMVMNPHLSYSGYFRYFEAQVTVPNEDLDVYGSGLVGSIVPSIAFNDYLGWSHTVNVIQGWVNYRITLTTPTTYLFDGNVLPITLDEYSFRTLQEDGSFQNHTVLVEKTIHGPIFARGPGAALASRWSGQDRPNTIRQRLDMLKATNLEEFTDAMRQLEFGFFTTAGATRDGDIFNFWNGWVPKREPQLGDWDYWRQAVDGSTRETFFTEIHEFDELPGQVNPATGWLQNANEPPWTMTFPTMDPSAYPSYMSRAPDMTWRAQMSARMVYENRNITFEQLIDLKHSAKHEMPAHVIPELLTAIDRFGESESIIEAGKILSSWDQALDADSVGALIFLRWLSESPGYSEIFLNPWSLSDPLGTPNTLRDPQRAVDDLQRAVDGMISDEIPLDLPYGEFFRIINPNGGTLPGHGGSETFRNTGYSPNGGVPFRGDTWVCVIEFTEEGARAKSLIGYGNASQGKHVDDQWEFYANKELRDVWRDKDDIMQHLNRIEEVSY